MGRLSAYTAAAAAVAAAAVAAAVQRRSSEVVVFRSERCEDASAVTSIIPSFVFVLLLSQRARGEPQRFSR